jgi:hypothetical protein
MTEVNDEKRRLTYHELIAQMLVENPLENADTLAKLCSLDPHNSLEGLEILIPAFKLAHAAIEVSQLNKRSDAQALEVIGQGKLAFQLTSELVLKEKIIHSINLGLEVLRKQLVEYPQCETCGTRVRMNCKFCTQCGKPFEPKEGEAPS